MRSLIVTYLPWLLSAVTVYAMVLAGNKNRHAWAVSIANQALWLVYIVAAGAWGLLPMNAALWIVFVRNYRRWKQSSKDS